MKPMTVGKLAAGIAGTAGAGSMGVLAEALARFAAARTVPAALWAVMAALIGVTAAVAALALLLDFRRKKLEIQSVAVLEQGRQEMYRAVLEKSAAEPGSAASYRELIVADALHLAVERNGVQPADQTHRYLLGRGPASGGSVLGRPSSGSGNQASRRCHR
jgi:Co/Zn/Cd efflux system component